MKDDDTNEASNKAKEKLTQGATSHGETDGNASKSKPSNKKSKNTKQRGKKRSLRQHWKAASRRTQVEWILKGLGILIAGLAAIGTLGMLGFYVWDHVQAQRHFEVEHRPRIIVTRPIELTGHVIYSTQTGELTAKGLTIWFKNISSPSDAIARKVFALIYLKPVPEVQIEGDSTHFVPNVTKDTCKHTVSIPAEFSDLSPGAEGSYGFANTGKISTVKFKPGTQFRLYAIGCVYYSEESGVEHTTCDQFQFINLTKKPEGVELFPVDHPITGSFIRLIIGHCAN